MQELKKITFLLLVSVFFIFPFSHSSQAGQAGTELRSLAVQDSGRIKPFDTFAKEVLEIVYGKKTYESKPAYEVVLTWMLSPELWQEKAIFEIRNQQVLKALDLPEDKRWYKGQEVFGHQHFSLLMQELQAKRQSKEKLNPYFQALQRIENQFFVFQEIATGRMLRLVPNEQNQTWISVSEMPSPYRESFLELAKAFIGQLEAGEIVHADRKKDLDQRVQEFQLLVNQNFPNQIDSEKLHWEVWYNDVHPFRLAYILYLIASVVLLISWIFNRELLVKLSWALVISGFLIHTLGFAIRVYLAGRPPVSNMYETVVWVAWGAVVFSMVLESIYRFRFILLSGSLIGVFSLVIADSAPAVLDPGLQPLEAVLRSSYWLIVHVMTITISYAAFFLAFVLGDMGLIYYLKGEEQNKDKIRKIVLAIYRSMQIGVSFLAPGIILGGIWADESWGRFWGWDPKETWALIALLGYLAVLHGRLTNWIKDFALVVSSVATFSLVIMAWYGVNFVLGAGLHSYGFGAGGVEYVSAFVLIHFIFVAYVAMYRRDRKLSSKA